jgi:hypothetical protein
MDENLKTTIMQKLEELSEEQARQLLDYMEFLESKYNRSSRNRSAFEKIADNVEGTLRASSIGGAAIKGTGQVLDAASELMRGVVSAGRSVLDELQRLEEEAEAGAKAEESAAEEPASESVDAETPEEDSSTAASGSGVEEPGEQEEESEEKPA